MYIAKPRSLIEGKWNVNWAGGYCMDTKLCGLEVFQDTQRAHPCKMYTLMDR